MSFLRFGLLALVLAAGLAAPASAATYNIVFFGSEFPVTSGPQVGSGSFTAPDGPVSFSDAVSGTATVAGKTYALTGRSGFPSLQFTFQPSDFFSQPYLNGYSFEQGQTAAPGPGVEVLQFVPLGVDGVVFYGWAISPCPFACGGGVFRGTFTITRVSDPEPPVVPLPASAALLPLGLGALALIRRRRAA
jgi:hypothetical protein